MIGPAGTFEAPKADETMVYVAADPTQPGAAWAACVDDPRWAKDTAKDMWENLDKTRPDSAHYSVMRKASGVEGMDALRSMFPEAKANELNFALFSTSGVHGTYNTIEDAELFLIGDDAEGCSEVTFLIVHPRLVAMRYGVCNPVNQDDIDYLKRLRASSQEAVAGIGAFVTPNSKVTGRPPTTGDQT